MNRFVFHILKILVFASNSFAQDSLFINSAKEFIFEASGVKIDSGFYDSWSNSEKPYLYLYVSSSDQVKRPEEQQTFFYYCGTNEDSARAKEESFNKVVDYHTFIYKTYALSGAELNGRFMSYEPETKCFIIFHEFVHRYIQQLRLPVPYDFNEALADVIGNYGTIEYFKAEKADLKAAKSQKSKNEKFYAAINTCIAKIKLKPSRAAEFRERCERKIEHLLKDGDLFQHDRFNYEINNAFLLKNKYYSENYFLLKSALRKHKTLKDFLATITGYHGSPEDFGKYIEALD